MNAHGQPDSAPWYSGGLSFQCTSCGNCCTGPPGYVWVSPEEAAAIAALCAMPLDEFLRRHTRRIRGRRSLLERPNGDCEFLRYDPDGKRRCSIYAARPTQCRTWPFWYSNLRSEPAWRAAGRDCPGIDQQEHHPLPVIQAALARNRAAALEL